MTKKITIQGLVQGVGFRPFIYLLAKEMDIKGTVSNHNNGVIIYAALSQEECNIFTDRILKKHPQVATIHKIEVEEIENNLYFEDFEIIKS
ncbi:MAG: acylphosphatase, partial [Prevotella sp.]|nr:acylphosphatase [Prevotella sp.]